jgi:hypothetical protein
MSPQSQSVETAAHPAELESIFLDALRQRFKAEVNRMTGGAMRRLLAQHPDADALSFPLSYLYAYHWLRANVPPAHRAGLLAAFRNPARRFLMELLLTSVDAGTFVRGYVERLSAAPAGSRVQAEQLKELLAEHGGDADRVAGAILSAWEGLGLFAQTSKQAYSELGRLERARYRDLLGREDLERLALIDALPDPGGGGRFAKLGLIPAMGCPQTCRHCMFIWRPPMRGVPDPEPLFRWVNAHTDNLLFTGGDLSRHIDSFTRAIHSMSRVQGFAILLNGDFANDMATTRRVLGDMAAAVRRRPRGWPPARVLLQISFDEFHQEVLVDKRGKLRERIPVDKIANIVECATRYREIQLCLVHKQTALSFSMDVLRRGVFGRLTQELGRRGHRLRVLSSAASPRLKRHPHDLEKTGPVLKDASFVLARYPDRPILLTSSTVDAYGRAQLLDEGETVKERDLLARVLAGNGHSAEAFDTDLMLWYNGWVTLFAAVHLCLGDFHRDGGERILARHRKDPLTAALRNFDLRLLDLYAEVRGDLQARIDAATGPHHLLHTLTEDPEVRLHLTRRLAALPRRAS